MHTRPLKLSDIHDLFGQIDDHRALEIFALNPSPAELEVAAAYFKGMDDVMGEWRQPLAGTPAKIFEILNRDQDLFED